MGSVAQGAANIPFSYLERASVGSIGRARLKHTTRPSDVQEMTASSSIGSRWIGGLKVPSEELTEDAADDSSALESPNIAE
jgi:hypothetical protein